jgi:hypothetical protein
MTDSQAATTQEFINQSQAVCLEFYSQGAFEHLLKIESEVEFKATLADCGDGLLRFLMTELSTKEDCDTVETAMNRVSTAIEDLNVVRRNLNSLCSD